MKICLVGSYPPRKCGIATFSRNLLSSLKQDEKFETFVVALNDDGCYEYSGEVPFVINQSVYNDYAKAADYINENADMCILQHEYGIFGGEHGVYVLSLLNKLRIPVVVTLHTILKEPSFLQKIILQQIAAKSEKVIVMSRLAVKFLKTIYHIPEEKIAFIEHGVPHAEKVSATKKELLPFSDKKILFTFGLLSRGKGIETVIEALPKVVKNHPDVVYVFLGKTHPAVAKHSGEEYRNYLKRLANELNVDEHVYFIDKFVTDEELLGYLKSIDVYITPYLNEAQITSGTLSYAIGAGTVVVSTPYWHAQELLSNGRGRLFPFKDSEALSEILNELLDDESQMESIRSKAFQYGQHLKWPLIGARYLALAEEAVEKYEETALAEILNAENEIPPFSLEHLKRLTDSTGIIQHAAYGIPNWKEGYCLDDNARALLTVLMAYRQFKSSDALQLMPVYLSYIHYMQREDGKFRNFLHFNRNYLDKVGSEDSFGRAVWALGYLIRYSPNNSYKEFALNLFNRSFKQFTRLRYLRGIANTMIGISHYLKAYPNDEGMLQVLMQLTKKLVIAYHQNSSKRWNWFEKQMTYDNAILPLALLHSCEITNNAYVRDVAMETLGFLEKKTLYKEHFIPIGNRGWHTEDSDVAVFDQQAIDVMAMIFMYQQAFFITKEPQYLKNIHICFSWFLGKNELHVPLYDTETHGCCDGLNFDGINRNQGAESTLAYLTSYLLVLKTKELQYELEKQDMNKVKKIESVAV